MVAPRILLLAGALIQAVVAGAIFIWRRDDILALPSFQSASSSPVKLVVVWLVLAIYTNVAMSAINHLRGIFWQFKLFGFRWLTNVPVMWQAGSLRPYVFASTKSDFKKTPRFIATLHDFGMGCFYLLLTLENPVSLTSAFLTALACLQFTSALTYVTFHGRTPVILVLGVSTPRAVQFANMLNLLSNWRYLGVVNLLDAESHGKNDLTRVLLASYRTLDQFGSDWARIVAKLIDLTPCLVVDARVISPAVLHEIGLIERGGALSKSIFLISEGQVVPELLSRESLVVTSEKQIVEWLCARLRAAPSAAHRIIRQFELLSSQGAVPESR